MCFISVNGTSSLPAAQSIHDNSLPTLCLSHHHLLSVLPTYVFLYLHCQHSYSSYHLLSHLNPSGSLLTGFSRQRAHPSIPHPAAGVIFLKYIVDHFFASNPPIVPAGSKGENRNSLNDLESPACCSPCRFSQPGFTTHSSCPCFSSTVLLSIYYTYHASCCFGFGIHMLCVSVAKNMVQVSDVWVKNPSFTPAWLTDPGQDTSSLYASVFSSVK